METSRVRAPSSQDVALIVLKAMTYRLLGSGTTALLVYIVGGHSVTMSALAGLAECFLKFGLYLFHELIWNSIRAKAPQKDIPFVLQYSGSDLVPTRKDPHQIRLDVSLR